MQTRAVEVVAGIAAVIVVLWFAWAAFAAVPYWLEIASIPAAGILLIYLIISLVRRGT